MRAVVFDFDGTIANTIPALRTAVNRALEELGFPTHTDEEVRTYVNYGSREMVRRALPAERREDQGLIDRATELYNKYGAEACFITKEPYPGVGELFLRLKQKEYAIGVLSNKHDPVLQKITPAILPKGSFDAIQGVAPGLPTKPDPALTLRILEKLGVDAKDAVFVGDSEIDLFTAENAGLYHIGVTWGYKDEADLIAAGAKHLAHTAEELETLIEKHFSEGQYD
ncbi:MAG: HAD family hydrolase [Clostridia bacterium]|nr:HAD family hydrolase [Clostridia bacterium]